VASRSPSGRLPVPFVVDSLKPGVNGQSLLETVTKPFVRQPPSRNPANPCGWKGNWYRYRL